MKAVTYSRLRALRRMPKNTAATIVAKMNQYADAPEQLANNVIALRGETGVYRMRVGDWRVIFTKDGEVIAVMRVAPRGSAYE